jgi:hypothetical protein
VDFVTDRMNKHRFDESAWAKAAVNNLSVVVQPEFDISDCFKHYFTIVGALYCSGHPGPINPLKLVEVLSPVLDMFSNDTKPALNDAEIEFIVRIVSTVCREVREEVVDNRGERSELEVAKQASDHVLKGATLLILVHRARRLDQITWVINEYRKKRDVMREQSDTRYEMLDSI